MHRDVVESIESLPARFRGTSQPRTRYRLHIGSCIRDVVLDGRLCEVEVPRGDPAIEIRTDPDTWMSMEAGTLSGIEAFGARRLTIRGSIERALHFEPSFERPPAGGMRYSIDTVRCNAGSITALFAGDPDAPPLVLIHGLGATKSSWLTVIPQLARSYRVIAMDMPGFGASSKPVGGAYNAEYFADQTVSALDTLGLEKVLLAGNSMGGRISMEIAMRYPERVQAIACLCPATPFSRRPFLRFVQIVRPELGIIAGRLPRSYMKTQLRLLFADPDVLENEWYEAAIDDFLAIWRKPAARIAFWRAARNIYLEEGSGTDGFWARLEKMETPALYFYGRRDVLITHHFAKRIRRHVAGSKVVVWGDCGHVPQIEHPDRTVEVMLDFFRNHTRSRRSRTQRVAAHAVR